MRVSWFSRELFDRQRIADWLKQNKLGIVLLPLLGFAVSILFEKFVTMLRLKLFALIAAGLQTSHQLSFWEKASLFRSDLLCCFVLIPVVFCVLTGWLSPRWRIYIAILAAFLVQVVVVVELLAFRTTYVFPSFRMLWFATSWAISTHHTSFGASSYHPSVFTAPLIAAVLAFPVFLGIIALVALRRNISWLNHAVLMAFGLGALLTAIAYVPRTPAMPWSQPLLQMTVYPALFGNEMYSSLDSLSVPELLQAYREAEHVPAPEPTAFTGKAKNYNVLLFVMEAMTAQAFDPARDSLSDMPNILRLRDHSFLLGRHYTSYPLTDNATLSIFTSLYVHHDAGGLLDHQVELPGLIRSLRNDGYATGFYGFVWNPPQHRDAVLLASLGFEKIAASPSDPKVDESGMRTFLGPVEFVARNDYQALLWLRADIRNWTARRQRFAAAFFPEVGHDPYRELNGRTSRSMLERAHALAVYQDAWLGELLDELQRDGVLDNTIIVLTGDHGMRWTVYPMSIDSMASHPMLDDVTLRVPMLIYVPGVLKHSIFIDTPTSHIDIAPTILDLEGISAGRELEQGSPVYSPGIDKRRLFLQMNFLGATGYYFDGYYYSCSSMDIVYKSRTLNFTESDMLPFDSPEARQVRNILSAQDTNETALISRVLAGQ